MIEFRKAIEPLMPYVPGKPIDDVKREFGLDHVVKLASNENPLGCSENVKRAVMETLQTPALYPDGNCTQLRNALAKKHGVSENQLLFGCGTDEIISMIGKVFINPSDQCITGAVSFSQYSASVLAMGGEMVYAPMKNHGFDLQAIASAITDKTRVIFIANPNNPTGTMHSQQEQEQLMKQVPANVVVAFDEAYSEFVEDSNYPNTLSMLKQYPNIMYLKTFSKAYGLASLRVGYAISTPEIIAEFEKIRNPFNVSVQAQAAAVAALSDEAFLQTTIKNNQDVRAFFCQEISEMGLFYIPSQANFVMVDTKKDSKKLFSLLMERGYIIRPGAAFGMDTFLRVTMGTMEEMKGFLKALKQVLASF